MEFILLISGLLFCISFVIFIFLKSYIDNKKEKAHDRDIYEIWSKNKCQNILLY